jgi:hypothetical protein
VTGLLQAPPEVRGDLAFVFYKQNAHGTA